MLCSCEALLVLTSFCLLLTTQAHEKPGARGVWNWKCLESRCEKVLLEEEEEPRSLDACKLFCGGGGTLWPYPTGKVQLGKNLTSLNPNSISLESSGVNSEKLRDLLRELGNIFRINLAKMHPSFDVDNPFPFTEKAKAKSVLVTFDMKDTNTTSLSLDTDEAYLLHVFEEGERINARIEAGNYFGARHGLETFSQLIFYNDLLDEYQVAKDAYITDEPAFPHRGLLLDTARNYFSVSSIKRTIDAMAYNKLNVFHWHITDSHSFPFSSKSYPKLTEYGAYSPRKVYTPEDIKGVVEYARVRGVKVLPEFDAPAHVGEGWQWAEQEGLGRLTVCVKAEPWQQYCVEPPCGQLNPVNDNTYEVLGGIYSDMLEVFDSDVFHMGGDEVNINCWNSSKEITDWLEQNGKARNNKDFLDLWNMFQTRALNKLIQSNNGTKLPIVLWTSHLTEKGNINQYLDNNTYIIQIWTKGSDSLISELVEKGYRVIFSNYDAWYFDCGYGAWVGEGNNWCSPYIGWQKVYDNSPLKILSKLGVDVEKGRRLVLGGEAALWSEQVDEQALDGKLWPRGAALAERLWTDPDSKWKPAEFRMIHHRERLVQRGIQADSLQPQWCHQNEGYCHA